MDKKQKAPSDDHVSTVMTVFDRRHMFFKKNAIVPLVRWPDIADHFVDPTVVSCYSVVLGEQVVMTAPLLIGITVNLLKASQSTHLLDEPITDMVGEDFRLARLYFRISGRSGASWVAMLNVFDDVTSSQTRDYISVGFGYTYCKRVDRYNVGIKLTGFLNRRTGECKVTGGCDYQTMDIGIEVIGYTLAASRVPR